MQVATVELTPYVPEALHVADEDRCRQTAMEVNRKPYRLQEKMMQPESIKHLAAHDCRARTGSPITTQKQLLVHQSIENLREPLKYHYLR